MEGRAVTGAASEAAGRSRTVTLDEWVDLIRTTIGPPEFKRIGVEFLREHFNRSVQYTDGKGDGGVDAWVILQSEPEVRLAGQFHAGKSQEWDAKVEGDLRAFCGFRDSLREDDPARQDFTRMFFVTSQVTDATFVEMRTQELFDRWGVRVAVRDARAIASLALENKTELWRLIARCVPGYDATAKPALTARDEALLAFSFFHEKPAKYRSAVAKSAIATVLHRHEGALERDQLAAQTTSLLQLTEAPRLIERTMRDLCSERMIEIEGETVRATDALLESTRASLTLANDEQQKLRARCVQVLEPLVPRGRHRRGEVAARAVEVVFDDLGLLIQSPIAEQVLYAVDPSKQPRSRFERDAFVRWRGAAKRVEQELGADDQGHQALEAVVREIAGSTFARNLAAAELFLRLTEHDAPELTQALTASAQCVLIDTSVALPMVCALFDEPVLSWKTSLAASELHGALKARGTRCVVPSVYLEEMASHLLRARSFADVIESESDLERSRNYFVAHFCSLRGSARSAREFNEFLVDFGAPRPSATPWAEERRRAEHALRDILTRYSIDVERVDEGPDDPRLPGEPAHREPLLLRHDRAVVRELQRWSKAAPRWLVCTADGWLRTVLNDRDIVAVDNVGLADLLELVQREGSSRSLLSPLELASSIGEQARELAASVWDTIVSIEGPALRDRALIRRAREFRSAWLAERVDLDLQSAWIHFRDSGTFRSGAGTA
jgi:hypothetical protein